MEVKFQNKIELSISLKEQTEEYKISRHNSISELLDEEIKNFLKIDDLDLSNNNLKISDKPNISNALNLEEGNIKEILNIKFFKSCERGDNEKILSMLKQKFSIDRKPDLNQKYLHDFTVLHITITNRHFDSMKILLDQGADIESETSMKRRPLHLAVIIGDFIMTDYLISCGADINCVDIDNNTPLHYASRMGYNEILEYLIYKHARIDVKNIFGESPLDIVCNSDIFEIFINYLGEEKAFSLRSKYTRQFIANNILHNNRADNTRKILYKDQIYSNKYIYKSTNMFINNLDNEILFYYDEKVDLNSFKILQLIGNGSFGQVYLVELIKNKKNYAMKVLDKKKVIRQNIIPYILTERNVLSSMKHPYIVELYYAFQTEEFLYLIMEYCEGRDLSYHLNKHLKFREDIVRIILAQLLLAVEELHKHGIIYRDLKPDNIVLDKNGFIKLTDFGLSKQGVYDNTSAKSFCGSLAYLAPEVLNRQGHGKSVDWYLFGVLMYEMLIGLPPFYTTVSKEALFHNIQKGKLNFPEDISSDAKSLIIKLLNRNPHKRLGSGHLDAKEIKSHPFFALIDFNQILDKNFIPPKFPTSYKITSQDEIQNFLKNNYKIYNKEVIEDMKNNFKCKENLIDGWTFIHTKKQNYNI